MYLVGIVENYKVVVIFSQKSNQHIYIPSIIRLHASDDISRVRWETVLTHLLTSMLTANVLSEILYINIAE
jgi:hypothetical protein